MLHANNEAVILQARKIRDAVRRDIRWGELNRQLAREYEACDIDAASSTLLSMMGRHQLVINEQISELPEEFRDLVRAELDRVPNTSGLLS